MNNEKRSNSIYRWVVDSAGVAGWIVALILAVILLILNIDNRDQTVLSPILLSSMGAVTVAFALISIFIIYFMKDRQIGEVRAPSTLTDADFEKFVIQLTDLRVGFKATALIVPILLVALTFVGYTTIKDVASETRVEEIDKRLTILRDSLSASETRFAALRDSLSTVNEDFQKQKEVINRSLNEVENKFENKLEGFDESRDEIARKIAQRLKEEFRDSVVLIPNFEEKRQIRISAQSEVIGEIILGTRIGSGTISPGVGGSTHRILLTFANPDSVIRPATLWYPKLKKLKFITR